MTKQIIPLTFTDSDGDTFAISNIRVEDWDGGQLAVFFTVKVNGEPIETLEWIDDDGFLEGVDSNLNCNHLREFGREAIDFIWSSLASWLSENRQVAA